MASYTSAVFMVFSAGCFFTNFSRDCNASSGYRFANLLAMGFWRILYIALASLRRPAFTSPRIPAFKVPLTGRTSSNPGLFPAATVPTAAPGPVIPSAISRALFPVPSPRIASTAFSRMVPRPLLSHESGSVTAFFSLISTGSNLKVPPRHISGGAFSFGTDVRAPSRISLALRAQSTPSISAEFKSAIKRYLL